MVEIKKYRDEKKKSFMPFISEYFLNFVIGLEVGDQYSRNLFVYLGMFV